ncbi:D-alanine--poly(phosphoribitol) ligase [Streptomyces sp. PKU-MA01144]|uniref:AMP-binding protein n=1 Tax=Streptomyces TaxID=1883 RepID=UPI00147BD203|nr:MULTISPECIES: AMP-binding protein [Streptomyces]MCY0982109.1 AMP-binding protein [Streptomyces tirandamycinicus]NNJ06194.1 D-alanine--poly(phosphoribitol) ligase [Streptomyces sp. PKU-MA01144]
MTQPPGAPPSVTGEFLHDFLLARVPDSPAVVEPGPPGSAIVTTYDSLRSRAARYAGELQALDLEMGSRVLLEAEATADSIAMLLACSRAGLTFVPVSPETPRDRLLSLIGTARPSLHLQPRDGKREDLPPDLATARFGPGGITVERRPVPAPRMRRAPSVTDPAYIIFTSGTTGRPKGVVMSHRAVVAFYRGMLAHDIARPGDRIASTSPLQFDFSLLNIGLALGSGAAVVPVPQALVRWPRHFLRVLRDTEATQVNGVPSIWRQVLRHEPDRLAELDRLRGVLFCGEEFPLPELRRLQRLRPGMRIVNCYGATESMACSFEDVPDPLPEDVERLSIGVAHPGAEMLLVDESGRVVDRPGIPGEIHLRSPALFSGYWDDPGATRGALVPDPLCPQSGQLVLRTGDLAVQGEKGEFYFCGRTDSQVQINGNRVELGEVERRLLEFPGATAAAALPLPEPGGGSRLAAFVVVAARDARPHAGDLRDFCARTLPAYMVPGEIRLLDTLPTTTNGKVDRAALAASASPGPARVPATTTASRRGER